MSVKQRILANADIREINLEIPQGDKHLRTTIRLSSGEELILQEATVANLVRGYINVKTHPRMAECRLTGQLLSEEDMKEGYAPWQLLEE